jgi:orotidine-5'-phosphate decarboxylase
MLGIDRLIDRIDELGNPSVVGLDPSLSMMPRALALEMFGAYGETPRAVSEMFLLYNKAIIDAVTDVVPAVKPQIAMYERYGPDGLAAYIRTCEYAAGKGLYVIGDIKRGDISSTAEAYAAHLAGVEMGDPGNGAFVRDGGEGQGAASPGGGVRRVDLWHEDAITVNPYFGTDGIAPFTRACRETGKAIFVLVKTSNESSAELQDAYIEGAFGPATPGDGSLAPEEACAPGGRGTARGGPAGCGEGADEEVSLAGAGAGRPRERLYERVASLVERWGEGLVGERGYSAVGAVVGATHPEVGRALREAYPRMFFLVPGYGAQGARADDLAGFFGPDGRGCLVNSSRGIIAAWQRSPGGGDPGVSSGREGNSARALDAAAAAAPSSASALDAVAAAARAAALTMAADLRRILPTG